MLISLLIQTSALLSQEFIPPTKTPPHQIYSTTLILTSQNQLYAFSGFSSDGKFFNKVWKFDLETSIWQHLFLQSTIKPPARVGAIAFYNPYENSIIVYGGTISTGPTNDQWMYKIDEKTWQELPIVGMDPVPLTETSSACFYRLDQYWCAILGGLSRSGYDYNLYILDLLTLEWTKYEMGLDYYNFGQGHTLWYYEGCLYTFNSFDYISDTQNYHLLRINLTDFSIEEIQYTGSPQGRFQAWQVVYQDAAYYMPNFQYRYGIITSVWRLNLTDFRFQEMQVDLSEASQDAINMLFNGLAQSEEKVYTFSGTGGTYSNAIYKWDLSQNPIKVTQISKNVLVPSQRRGHTAAYCCGKIYMFGGISPQGQQQDLYSLSQLWVFDIETQIWTLQQQNGLQPSGRFGHSVVGLGYFMFYFDGQTVSGLTNQL